MSDLWLAAGEDAERDRYQHHLAMARTAAADSMAFALGAATPEEFEHRLALVSGSFDAAVATAVGDSNGFLDVRVALLDEVNADFGRIHAAREAEAAAERQRIAARRQAEAEAARKVALNAQFAKVAYGSCPYCGQPGCSPNCPGPQSTTVCPECGAGASVHNGRVRCNDPDGCGYGWDGKGLFDDSHNAAKRPPSDNSQDELINWGSTEDDDELIDWSAEKNKGHKRKGDGKFATRTAGWHDAPDLLTDGKWDEGKYQRHMQELVRLERERPLGGGVCPDCGGPSPDKAGRLCRNCGTDQNYDDPSRDSDPGRYARRKTASPFDSDLAKIQEAIEAIPGAVITEADGFTHLNMDVVPQDLADLYQNLMQHGYANGLVASRKQAADDLDDPIGWARYNAKGDSGSVTRVSGTTINAICDMIGDESNETVKWARRCAERAGDASVSQLSCSDVLTLCDMAEGKAFGSKAAWSRTKVAAANREVPTWTARAHNRDLVVIAINQGFTWAVYGDSDEPLAKGRAAKLEMAQRLAHTAAA